MRRLLFMLSGCLAGWFIWVFFSLQPYPYPAENVAHKEKIEYSIATTEIMNYILEEILPYANEPGSKIRKEDKDFIERQINKEIQRKLKQ